MNSRSFFIGFILIAVLQLLSAFVGWPVVNAISKCLLLPTLAGYYWLSVDSRSNVFLAALFFCWLGDILLIFPEYFLGGLAAFLTGHIAYIFSYRQHQWEDNSRELLVPQKIRFSLPVALTGTGLVVVLYPVLGGLKLPVLLYAMVIVVMVMTALFRYGRTGSSSFWLVFGGAVLFMASDSILAVNKFLAPTSYGQFWIMITYMAAQLMIVTGIVRHQPSTCVNSGTWNP